MSEVVKSIDILDSLKGYEAELKLIAEKHQEQIIQLQEEIASAEADEQAAKQRVIDTRKNDDPKEYSKAIADQRTASDVLGFYTGKLEKLKAEPLISKEQYDTYTQLITITLDKLNTEKKIEARKLLEELLVIEPELVINLEKGNEILSYLQRDLFKDDATWTNSKGEKIPMEHLKNRYKDYSMIQAINSILGTPQAGAIFK